MTAPAVTHWFMPIGRQGYDVSGEVAASAVRDGLMTRCGQCSHGNVIVYHDWLG